MPGAESATELTAVSRWKVVCAKINVKGVGRGRAMGHARWGGRRHSVARPAYGGQCRVRCRTHADTSTAKLKHVQPSSAKGSVSSCTLGRWSATLRETPMATRPYAFCSSLLAAWTVTSSSFRWLMWTIMSPASRLSPEATEPAWMLCIRISGLCGSPPTPPQILNRQVERARQATGTGGSQDILAPQDNTTMPRRGGGGSGTCRYVKSRCDGGVGVGGDGVGGGVSLGPTSCREIRSVLSGS